MGTGIKPELAPREGKKQNSPYHSATRTFDTGCHDFGGGNVAIGQDKGRYGRDAPNAQRWDLGKRRGLFCKGRETTAANIPEEGEQATKLNGRALATQGPPVTPCHSQDIPSGYHSLPEI